MSNNNNTSRITDAKDLELGLKFLMAGGDLEKNAQEYLNEVDRIENSSGGGSPASAVEEVSVGSIEDDIYTPPSQASVFGDVDDEDQLEDYADEYEDDELGTLSEGEVGEDGLATLQGGNFGDLGTNPKGKVQSLESALETSLSDNDSNAEESAPKSDDPRSQEDISSEYTPDTDESPEDTPQQSSEHDDIGIVGAVDPEDEEDEEEDHPALIAARKRDMTLVEKIKDTYEDLSPFHQKLAAGGVITAVVLIIALVVLLLTPKGDKPSEQNVDAPANVHMEQTQGVEAGIMVPTGMSVQCAEGEANTPLQNAFDPSEELAWVCERAFGIDGVVAEMTFDAPVEISKVSIVPGFNFAAPRGEDEWTKHRVVTKVLWRIGDEQFVQTINPARAPVEMTIPNLVSDKITMTVQTTADPVNAEGSAVRPAGADTFAISNITISGKPA